MKKLYVEIYSTAYDLTMHDKIKTKEFHINNFKEALEFLKGCEYASLFVIIDKGQYLLHSSEEDDHDVINRIDELIIHYLYYAVNEINLGVFKKRIKVFLELREQLLPF